MVKGRVGGDRDWFPVGTGGNANVSCTVTLYFCTLVLEAYNGASAGDGLANVANMGGVVVSNGGKGAVIALISTESLNTTVLGASSFPTCAAFAGLVIVLIVTVDTDASATAASITVSKRVTLLGRCDAVVKDHLGSGATSFFVGGRFLGYLVVLTKDLSGSSSSLD